VPQLAPDCKQNHNLQSLKTKQFHNLKPSTIFGA